MSKEEKHWDEELISGYLDGTLGQRESQKVRLLLEDDEEARSLYRELRALREAALGTRFVAPDDQVWPEMPQSVPSRWSRSLGWLLTVSWLVLVGGLALWTFLASTGDPLEIFLVLGLPGGFVLLLVSVWMDRLRDPDADRYRGVFR